MTVTGRVPGPAVRVRPQPVTTRVLCADPVLGEAAKAYLGGRTEIEVTSGAAEVVLVFGEVLDEDVRHAVDAALAEHAGTPSGGDQRLVLVVDEMAERNLWWAVGRGLTAVLRRSTTDWDDVVTALLKARDGAADLPDSTVGWLLDQVRALDTRLAAVGVNAAGLTVRETEILRLFAAGMEVADVARELNYSERTIKSAVHGVKERLGLRNRAHAVAHAVRIGAI